MDLPKDCEVNGDEDSYQPNHAYDRFLDTTVNCHLKSPKD